MGALLNRAVRRAAFERRPSLLRAFAIAVATQLLLLAAGDRRRRRQPRAECEHGWPALLPVAQLVGGLAFGAGRPSRAAA
jgi:hypothetical protein